MKKHAPHKSGTGGSGPQGTAVGSGHRPGKGKHPIASSAPSDHTLRSIRGTKDALK